MPSCYLFVVDEAEIVLGDLPCFDPLVVLIDELLPCLFILQHPLIVFPYVSIALVKALTHCCVNAHTKDGVKAYAP